MASCSARSRWSVLFFFSLLVALALFYIGRGTHVRDNHNKQKQTLLSRTAGRGVMCYLATELASCPPNARREAALIAFEKTSLAERLPVVVVPTQDVVAYLTAYGTVRYVWGW
ncbi:hypothetical protein CGRA01v4_00826 [Colletotrichum graminicola]|nr:hypothetical protein CGRA01v4_00826 [Colletotrichum graminicola]